MKMMKIVAGICFALAVAAQGALITEAEPNNTMATADTVRTDAMPWMNMGLISLAPGGNDVDFFSIALRQGDILTVTTTPLQVIGTTPDTYLGVLNPLAEVVASNDNGYGYGSMVAYQAPADSLYYIAVTGAGDVDFDGYITGGIGHGQVGNYQLTVSLIPEPATVVFIGLAGLALLVRRKK